MTVRKTFLALLTPLLFISAGEVHAQATGETPLYLDPAVPVETRINDLLSRMTLEEKVGQMNIPCAYKQRIGWGMSVGDVSLHRLMTSEEREKQLEGARRFAVGEWAEGIGPGGGFFTLPDRLVYEGTRRQAEILNDLQRTALTDTRLKIPLLQVEEGTHGLMCSGATIFPEGPALGSTWDSGLIERIYSAAALEGRSIGVHALCTLVIEPIRDPRLGRNEEAYSECPFMSSRIAEAIVRGVQGDDVSRQDKLVAALSHYPGQSEPVSGFERGAMHLSERKLREVFLPPWVAGVKKAGSLCLMATYPAVDGVSVHNSSWILKDILRGELGFTGVVLSEGRGISTIIDERVVDVQKEAGILAARAGVDVGISLEDAYLHELVESAREGLVPMECIDEAVGNILRLKYRLGLFENPYVDPDRAVRIVHSAEHQSLALTAAREGIVMLKNDNNTLPLSKNLKRIAIIGPNADDAMNQLGDYTPYNIITEIVTVLEGIRNKTGETAKIEYVKGCDIRGNETDEIAQAVKAAKRAEAAIVVVGESTETVGEGRDAATLELTGRQLELVQAVVGTKTPTVVVLINGRSLAIPWIAEHVPAILEAWNCGERGGDAVADILFGDCDPGGRLSVTVPRHAGQLPVYYDHSPTKETRRRGGYVDLSAEPLYNFGFGLSYTDFAYENLSIAPLTIKTGGRVTVSMDITNTGRRAGQDVVQLYVNDVLSSVTTPVRVLRGFEKVTLEPGGRKRLTFELGPEELSLLDRHLERVVEPGEFEVMIGRSSRDIKLTGTFTVVE